MEAIMENEITAVELKAKYDGLEVVDQPSFDAMQALGLTAKEGRKAIEAHMDPQIKEAHAKHKKLTQLRNEKAEPFKAIEQGAKKKCIAYQQEQERLADLERRRAEAKAEEERLKRAEAFEKQGDKEAADVVLNAPLPEIETASVLPKVKGAQKRWKAEIVDLVALCRAIGDGSYRPFLLEKRRALEQICVALGLNDEAVRLKEDFNVPGVQAVSRMM